METINKELVERLKIGEIALHFGARSKDKEAVQQLNKVLNLAFERETRMEGVYNYYFYDRDGYCEWSDTPISGKEIVELEDFFITEEKPSPKQGDTVWVRICEDNNWREQIFIAFIDLEFSQFQIVVTNKMAVFSVWEEYTFENPYKAETEAKIAELETEIAKLKQQL